METRPSEIKYRNKDDERHRQSASSISIRELRANWIDYSLSEINRDWRETLYPLNVKPR